MSKYRNRYDKVLIILNIYRQYSVRECDTKYHTDEFVIGNSMKLTSLNSVYCSPYPTSLGHAYDSHVFAFAIEGKNG